MAPRRAPRGPLHLEIYHEIKRAVLSGELPPGSVLSEAELSRRWSVSRTPIREAIRQLELEDLITWEPRRGATVTQVTVRGLRDMVELRQALEGLAVRLAAERRTDEDLAELQSILDRIDAAHRRGDIPATIELDDAFHRRIALASGNRLLAASADRLLDRVRFARSMARRVPGRQEEFQREHAAILRAIAARDPEVAERAMTEHVQRSRVRLMEMLERADADIQIAL
ncbi:MAG TPA: GntR family transcriptional regulator [Candidatus Dormibacteraeota bacterium]|nr:GntR family transcriptional regulator [Candidatus Dormibacteraeota bacterium]